MDEQGNHHAIGCASENLTEFEKNYTPFLLEMQGAFWGIEHLKGRPFLLFTDHKPLIGLGKVHKGTYNHLQQAMLDYNLTDLQEGKPDAGRLPVPSHSLSHQPLHWGNGGTPG